MKKLYIGLLVVVVVLVAGAAWMLSSQPRSFVPEETPVIDLLVKTPCNGAESWLGIYNDGTVISLLQSRVPGSDNESVQAWHKGRLKGKELDELLDFVVGNIDNYQEDYDYPTEFAGNEDSMFMMFVVRYDNIGKIVRARNYPSFSSSMFYHDYHDLPSPLGETYKRLREIVKVTEEYSRETVNE